MSVTAEALDLPPAPPAPGRATPWIGALAIAVCALTPVLAYLGNLGFAVLIALAGALCLPLRLRPHRLDLGACVLFALALWALASMAWSFAAPAHPDFRGFKAVEQLTAAKLFPQLALYGAFVAAVAELSRTASARASLTLGIGLLAISVVFVADAAFKAPVYQAIRAAVGQAAQRPDLALRDVSRTAYVLALMFWPAVLRLSQAGWRPAAAVLAAATVVGAYLLNADAPVAALIVSSAVFAAVRYGGRPAVWVLLAGVVLYFLAAPLVVLVFDRGQMLHPAANDIRVQSWAIRLDIWRFAVARILEHPFFGWGLDASRMFSPNIPLHTHDAAIQIWLELGAVGAVLACLFWAWVVVQIDKLEARDRPAAAAAAAAVAAYLTIGALSFGVWQEWWLALGALTAAVCMALAKGRASEAAVSAPEPS